MSLFIKEGGRLLIVALRAMGDVLLTTPIIRAVKQAHPAVHIDILVEALPASALRHNPYLRHIIISPARGSHLLKYLNIVQQLRKERYDYALDFLSTPGSGWLTRLSGAKFRLGWDIPYRRWAFNHRILRPKETIYAPLIKARFLSELGIHNLVEPQPELFPLNEDDDWAQDWLGKKGISIGRIRAVTNKDSISSKSPGNNIGESESAVDGNNSPQYRVIGLAPYCKRASRMWSIENWRRLITALNDRLPTVFILFAAPNEHSYLANLKRIEGGRVEWAGALDILKAAALLKRCRIVLTGENGLLHIAVAVKTPTYSIFCGKDAPAQWIPPESPLHRAADLRGSAMADDTQIQRLIDEILLLEAAAEPAIR